ncbi:MAG: DUF1997 domain-containing protein [Cyanobacteria bacterium J06621_3]
MLSAINNKNKLQLSNDYSGDFSLPAAADVSRYLASHHEWFVQCAHPMSTIPIDDNSYRLCPGRFKCFNFSVEPTVSLRLTQLTNYTYQIQSIPDENEHSLFSHKINFCISLCLRERQQSSLPDKTLTYADWDLSVAIQTELPYVLRTMPSAFIQQAGRQLLDKVVYQVVQQLTSRIKTDFSNRHLSSAGMKIY